MKREPIPPRVLADIKTAHAASIQLKRIIQKNRAHLPGDAVAYLHTTNKKIWSTLEKHIQLDFFRS